MIPARFLDAARKIDLNPLTDGTWCGCTYTNEMMTEIATPCDQHIAIARALAEAENDALETAALVMDARLDIYSEKISRPLKDGEKTKPLGPLCDRISAHMGRHVARLGAEDIRALKTRLEE